MTSGSKKTSHGTTTASQKAILNAGMKGGHGGKKGPAAPNMNRNKGHMKGKELISSRAAEAVLNMGTGIEVQQWRTKHYHDKVVLLHPTRTTEVEREDGAEPKEGEESAPALPERVYINAGETLDALARGFQHLPEPEGVDAAVDTLRIQHAQLRIDADEGEKIARANKEVLDREEAEAESKRPEAKQLPAGDADEDKPNGRRRG